MAGIGDGKAEVVEGEVDNVAVGSERCEMENRRAL